MLGIGLIAPCKETDMSKTQASSPNDAEALLNDWLTTQGTALSTGLAQFTSGQLAILTQWFELQVELAQQWQAQAANVMQQTWVAGDDSTEVYQPIRRMLEDLWSPWSNVLGRGGEQLA